jgi:hypothetical protein
MSCGGGEEGATKESQLFALHQALACRWDLVDFLYNGDYEVTD